MINETLLFILVAQMIPKQVIMINEMNCDYIVPEDKVYLINSWHYYNLDSTKWRNRLANIINCYKIEVAHRK